MDFIYNYAGWGSEALALALGAVFLVHGIPKIRKPAAMATAMGWPRQGVMLLGLVESVSALMVISGLGTMYGSLAMIAVMVGAIYHKAFQWKTPFKSDTSMGWEFDLVLLAGALTLLLG